jgi:phage tail tape-measure protein
MNPEQLQQLINEYNNMLASGQINKEEYVQLLQGVNIMEGIADDAEGLALKEQLNTILNAAISVASMAV